MKNRTVSAAVLIQFAALLAAKRETASLAAKAAKAAKEAAESLGLPLGEPFLLRDSDRSVEILVTWTVRPMAEIPARIDTFPAYAVVKLPA